jgi:hypothetical protein
VREGSNRIRGGGILPWGGLSQFFGVFWFGAWVQVVMEMCLARHVGSNNSPPALRWGCKRGLVIRYLTYKLLYFGYDLSVRLSVLKEEVNGWACIEHLKAKELRTAILSIILYLLLLSFLFQLVSRISVH